VTPLAEIISEALVALGVNVEVLMDPTMLVQLPIGNDGLPMDVSVLHEMKLLTSITELTVAVSRRPL
jgi:hypothetical protein